MQKSVFATECDVIRLYFENVEANIINDLYFETADEEPSTFGSKMDAIGKKVKEKIEKIIQAIKDFFDQIKRKHESAKIKAMLRSECARSKKLIKANVNDKAVMKVVAQLYKVNQKAFVEVRKVYDQFMGHKIDYETYCRKTDKIADDLDDAVNKIRRDADDTHIINPNSNAGAYKLSELTKRVNEVDEAYNKVMDKMRDDVIREEEKVKAACEKVVTDNTSSSATSKYSAVLSRVNKKVVAAIIAVVSITGAAAFCYNQGKSGNDGKVVNESAEDYFADIFGDSDDYLESAVDVYEEANIFQDILDM